MITENDRSEWKDVTGERYHFPNRYLKLLEKGTKVVYYKGKQTDKKFKSQRLSSDPHYFGVAEIGDIYEDGNSVKNDFYAEITKFKLFSKAVPIKVNGEYLELIPESRLTNYWRDGVRECSEDVYSKISKLG